MDYKKRMLGLVRKAVQEYDMINEGDRVAVGLSGGKDSMTLLWTLTELAKFYPQKYTIKAVTVNLGYDGFNTEAIEAFCKKTKVELVTVDTHIGEIVSGAKAEERPCSICANMRRGALNNAAVEAGCNVVALAHNKDDVIETLMMSLFYEGRLNTFAPVTHLTRKEINVIRPLIFADEKEIRAFMRQMSFMPVKNPCPHDGYTTRQQMKELLDSMEKDRSDVRSTVFGAVRRSRLDGWETRI